jgi:hypothetical protein
MAVCQSCGKPLGDGAGSCASCGQAVIPNTASASAPADGSILAPEPGPIARGSSAAARHDASRRTLAVVGALLAVAIVALGLFVWGPFGGRAWMDGFAGTWAPDSADTPGPLVIRTDQKSGDRGSFELAAAGVGRLWLLSIDGDTLTITEKGDTASLMRQGSSGEGLYGTWTGRRGETADVTMTVSITNEHGTTLKLTWAEDDWTALWVDGDKLVLEEAAVVTPQTYTRR